ncbi:uncharacterized protein PHACADRAFT_169343, partial [Phanerochaete carnosa HHB-10118-sp]
FRLLVGSSALQTCQARVCRLELAFPLCTCVCPRTSWRLCIATCTRQVQRRKQW